MYNVHLEMVSVVMFVMSLNVPAMFFLTISMVLQLDTSDVFKVYGVLLLKIFSSSLHF